MPHVEEFLLERRSLLAELLGVVRPAEAAGAKDLLPQLTDQPARGRFRTSRELFTKGPYPIARAAAAAALLGIAEDSTLAKATINIAAA